MWAKNDFENLKFSIFQKSLKQWKVVSEISSCQLNSLAAFVLSFDQLKVEVKCFTSENVWKFKF